MAASLTLYCLDELSDYLEFERLCHDLLLLEGYSRIEPLGGFKDKGRDAVHRSTLNNTETIFAYSVRTDWQVKLAEDAKKIFTHGHSCDELFFLTTGDISSSKRDKWIENIQSSYGWKLEIRGREWFRLMLDTKHPNLKLQHPAIFPPEIVRFMESKKEVSQQKYIFISFSQECSILAKWIAQKLQILGYEIWSPQLGIPKKSSTFEDIEEIIREQACCFLGIYSESSLSDSDLAFQKSLASSISKQKRQDFLVPIVAKLDDVETVSRYTSPFEPILFENWILGWRELLKRLETTKCQTSLPKGVISTLNLSLYEDVLENQPDEIHSNCLEIVRLPTSLYRFKIPDQILPELEEAGSDWAFKLSTENTTLSFHLPPEHLKEKLGSQEPQKIILQSSNSIDDIETGKVISELLKKSILVTLLKHGLLYCEDTKLYYFPKNLVHKNKLPVTRPDGSKTHVFCHGKRKYWKPAKSEYYHYYIAPNFSVRRNLMKDFCVLITTKYRLTDCNDKPLESNIINSRRKHLCKGWWNYEWMNRTLAISQYLSNENGIITIGDNYSENIQISAQPMRFYSTTSINEAKVNKSGKSRQSMLDALDSSSDEE